MGDANSPLNNDELTELRDLIWSAHGGEIDEAGLARLDDLVKSSAEARRLYVDYVCLLADMQFDTGLLSEGDAASKSSYEVQAPKPAMPISLALPVSRAAIFSFSRLTAWLLVAAVLTNIFVVGLMVVMLTPSLRKQIVWHAESEANEPAAEVLAKVAHTTGAVWSKPLDSVQAGQPIDLGQRELRAGSMELEFAKGASVTLLAPIRFEVRSSGEVHLDQGRLRARVPHEAIGFTVTTPQARVVDLGTEFGVEVGSRGDTEVHVIAGLVDFFPTNPPGITSTVNPRRLAAGQAARVDAGSAQISNVSFVPVKFAAKLPVPTRRYGKTLLLDLSKTAKATQSTNFLDGYLAETAIDGNMATFSHTAGDDATAWWQLDLGESRQVVAVILHNRVDQGGGRLRDICLKAIAEDGQTVVAESPVLNPKNSLGAGPENLHVGPQQLVWDFAKATGNPVRTRYLRVERTAPAVDEIEDGANILSLAEVQVFVSAEPSGSNEETPGEERR